MRMSTYACASPEDYLPRLDQLAGRRSKSSSAEFRFSASMLYSTRNAILNMQPKARVLAQAQIRGQAHT